ncbi:MAG: NupC/NupG family nucleoside CNT transporter [Bacteroidia bacterium]|nr:NupC/NupG family nucleoside CNT transporter [Bacteroidia bacterium]
MVYLQSVLGMVIFVTIAWLFSTNRRAIDWRLVGIGIILQVLFGILMIKVPGVVYVFRELSAAYVVLLDFSRIGSEFIFGGLANPNAKHNLGLIIAFQVLPIIIFFATLTAGLYYLGILQRIVYLIAWIVAKTMRLSGPESLSAAGNIFLGQTEAPLLIKPYIANMTYSEIMAVMTGGMATIAGSVMAAYISFLGGDDPVLRTNIAAHLLQASLMNVPAGIVMAKIIVPQTEVDSIRKELKVSRESIGVNLIDALASGASDGLKLALNVGAMLLAFVALIAMINYGMEALGSWMGLNDWIRSTTHGTFSSLSLQYVLGIVAQPLAWAMGISWDQSLLVGSLLGQKAAINEFVAYADLGRLQAEGLLTPHSILISTYALCGFANFSSIAIQIGGISGMAPNQQANLSRLGLRALLAASLACMMTGNLAGLING